VDVMIDIIKDTLLDAVKILPFLWIAFFLIELFEHKYSKKTIKMIENSGKVGPLLGGVLGCFPQCGFSVMATNLYVTRIITMGTLVSVYLSTSDEMLPILLSHGSSFSEVAKILGVKVGIAIVFGFLIDLLNHKKSKVDIHEICEEAGCHCERGIFLSSLRHTVHTILFIMLVSFGLNLVMEFGGSKFLMGIFNQHSFLTPFLASLIGLIPNCAASVIITELYLSGVLSFSSVIAGLLTGSGVALLVLFRTNKNLKENVKILLLIYFIGVISGLVLELFMIS